MQEEELTIPELVDEVRAGKMSRRQFVVLLSAAGISAVGIGAITAVAARSYFSAGASPAKPAKAPDNLHQLHDQHLANQEQGNINALHNDYADHAIVEDSMFSQPFVGRTAILARKQVGFTALPNLKIAMTNRVVHGNQLSVEWVASGIHAGDLPGLPATGRSFSIPGVTVVVREGGKIVRESIYYDVAEVQRQLGPV
jgi:steroid delta-isomerase-like uncharacterized protein